MTEELMSILPLVLREKEALTETDIQKIKEQYCKCGRDQFEAFLRTEKSNVPFASLLLSEIDCDADYWRTIHNTYVNRSCQIIDFLKPLFTDYYQNGGRTLCVVENFASMLSSGISVGCFASNDVDMTADIEEKEYLKNIFSKNGFVMDHRGNHPMDNKQITTFYNKDVMNGQGYWLNVMWTPVSRTYLLPQSKTSKRLQKERVFNSECYQDTDIRILRPTALVYFCAIHQACEHYYSASPGMTLQCDIDRVVRTRTVDWDSILSWSKEDDYGCRITMSLDVCNYCLGTPVPLDKFDRASKIYKKLRKNILSDKSGQINPQLGKVNRLYVELASDNKPIIWALISRMWRK